MKIWAISDTHTKHLQLIPPDPNEVDMVILAGDAGSHRDLSHNDGQIRDFLQWYNNLPYKYKIYVAGNHCTSVEAGFHNFKDYPEVIYLEHNSINIEDINIFGSPYTPSFGHGWAFNIPRHKLAMYWEQIPNDTDIIITHGPPKGILDLTAINNSTFTQTGCKALLNKIAEVNPKLHIFGHLHDEKDVFNAGILQINQEKLQTKFINASVLNLQYNVCNNGIYVEI